MAGMIAKFDVVDDTEIDHVRGSGKICRVRTPLESALLFIIVFLVIVGIGLAVFVVDLKGDSANKEVKILKTARSNETKLSTSPPCLTRANITKVRDFEVRNDTIRYERNLCLTESCVSEASNLLKSMDQTVDPCEDFYSFVCGNWIRNTHLAGKLESRFTKMNTVIVLRVKEILETSQKETNIPEHKKKALDFYKACMDEETREKVGAEQLYDDLTEFGGWPLIEGRWKSYSLDWADLMVKFFKAGYLNNMLFSIKVSLDTKNTSRSLIEIGPPSLGLNHWVYYIVPNELPSAYKKVIFLLAKHFRENLGPAGLMEIEEAFKIEEKLAILSTEANMKDVDVYYNIMTVEELEYITPKIPWTKILTGMLPHGTKLGMDDRIMVTVPKMIVAVNNLIAVTGKRSLANYMFYRAVFSAAQHLSRKFYLLVSTITDTAIMDPSLSWIPCVKSTMESFPHSLTASYVTKYLDKQTKGLLDTMFEDLTAVLINDIQDSKWLDLKTKNYAVLKVKKIKTAIAYQEEIMDNDILNDFYSDIDVSISDHFKNVKEVLASKLRHSMEGLHTKRDRLRWTDVDDLLTANAYYYRDQNSIVIPVGVVQDQIFQSNRPNYINYGSLGMIVGHELTHAFDSTGRMYNAEGSYFMWWTRTSLDEYLKRTKCYENQYSEYYVPSAKVHVDGKLTLSENIADNGGLQTAYRAYNKLLKRIGSEKSLPGLKYNEKQMFWISFASIWCRKQTEESAQSGMLSNVHTPSRFRVIGSLSNMEEFSQDFNCKLHSTMHPEEKCYLWEMP